MEAWSFYSHPNLSVTLRYPNPTPAGNSVSIQEISGPSSFRAHFVSEGSNEVYFEIARYSEVAAEQAIDNFLSGLSQRIQGLEVSKVDASPYAGYPAHRFTIQWPGRERAVLFLEREDTLYRIIHDPTSTINTRMLEGIKFR